MTNHSIGFCVGFAAFVVGTVGCGWGGDSRENPGQAAQAGAAVATEAADKVVVTLSDAKLEAAGIRVQTAALREIPEVHTVPGRIDYDDRRHAAVRVATPGIVVDIRVKPGDSVESGQPLAVVSSPELGEVRADALRRQAEWEIAQRKYEWEAEIESNLTPFIAALRQRVDVKVLDEQFRTLTLGEHREKLTSAFARWTLAESLLRNANSVASEGVLSGRTLQERASERAAADAALLAACEQSTFDARQRKDQAALAVADAERRLEVSRQQVRTLLGYEPASQPGSEDQDPSLVEIRAPFAGTIERRGFSTAERVQPNDELFVLADTTRLWVVADVREKDWGATRIQPGAPISVRIPAIPDREFTARVHYVGREVSTDSNAVSVVAELDNQDGQLRPGLFVQADLTIESGTKVLSVPASAIVTHGQHSLVFVQEKIGTYRCVNVQVGRQTDEWVEIISGLTTGDLVVVHGSFVLKSELLLEPEE